MTVRSRFDDLHDRFDKILTTKAGTRYERLAALVFKVLNENRTVIHDLRLVGDSDVKHQIDVIIEEDWRPRRVLIECKDFDVSGDPVGLDIVRSFFAVVEDTKPDEAIVVTCNDFTADARKYAKAKAIKLAILRDFRDADWEGRVRRFKLRIGLIRRDLLAVELKFAGDEVAERAAHERLRADCAAAGMATDGGSNIHDPIFVNGTTNGRVQLNEFVSDALNERQSGAGDNIQYGTFERSVPLLGMTLEVENRGPIALHEMVLRYSVSPPREWQESVVERVASLVLKGFGDSDVAVWEDDIKRLTIDEQGEVRSR